MQELLLITSLKICSKCINKYLCIETDKYLKYFHRYLCKYCNKYLHLHLTKTILTKLEPVLHQTIKYAYMYMLK